MRDANGKTIRGKRGASAKAKRRDSLNAIRLHDIHSRIGGLPSGHTAGTAHNVDHCKSSTAVIADAAKYYDCATIEETIETHLIPRQSVTRQQLLSVFPQQIETEAIPTRQITQQRDKRTGQIVEVADELQDNRLTWKSDRTLLRRGNPFKDAESGDRAGFKREGSVSVGLNTRKYRDAIPNADPEPVKEIGIELENAEYEFVENTITDEDIAAALDE